MQLQRIASTGSWSKSQLALIGGATEKYNLEASKEKQKFKFWHRGISSFFICINIHTPLVVWSQSSLFPGTAFASAVTLYPAQ
jgi:hypothetical protein